MSVLGNSPERLLRRAQACIADGLDDEPARQHSDPSLPLAVRAALPRICYSLIWPSVQPFPSSISSKLTMISARRMRSNVSSKLLCRSPDWIAGGSPHNVYVPPHSAVISTEPPLCLGMATAMPSQCRRTRLFPFLANAMRLNSDSRYDAGN